MKYPLVYVHWRDAAHDGGWSTALEETTEKLPDIHSWGLLIHEDKDRLILASTWSSSNEEVANKQYIPRKMVIKRVQVRWGKR